MDDIRTDFTRAERNTIIANLRDEYGNREFSDELVLLECQTEEEGDKVWVSGYGHDEMQTSEGVDVSDTYINIPEAMDERHNKCYCLYRK